jgi:hypothetical protein
MRGICLRKFPAIGAEEQSSVCERKPIGFGIISSGFNGLTECP